MNRNRFIYFTDLVLVPVFVMSIVTGIGLHVAGESLDHEMWYNHAVFHTIMSLLFMICGIIHIKSHWKWYKSLKTIGCKGKRKVVLALSVVFSFVVVSGLLLLFFIDGANSPIGLLHYRTGIILSVLGVLHLMKRKKILYKGVLNYVAGKKMKE
ncbi:DUF4405 domain-containing protein [Phocaeicola faecalis]